MPPSRGPFRRPGAAMGPSGSGRPRASVASWREPRNRRPRALAAKSLTSATRANPGVAGEPALVELPGQVGDRGPASADRTGDAESRRGGPRSSPSRGNARRSPRVRRVRRCGSARSVPRGTGGPRPRRSRARFSFRRRLRRGCARRGRYHPRQPAGVRAARLVLLASPRRREFRAGRGRLHFAQKKKAPGRGGAARGAKGGG